MRPLYLWRGMLDLWREATPEQRRWIFWNAVVIAAAINAVLNALIAWGSAAGEDEVPLLAAPLVEGPSTITDTVGTFFILPFLTTLIITTVAWHELVRGKLSPLSRAPSRLPPTRVRRGVYLGAICTVLLAPPAVLVLILLDFGDLGVGEFVLYKAVFGVVLGALVTPPIALFAMANGRPVESIPERSREAAGLDVLASKPSREETDPKALKS